MKQTAIVLFLLFFTLSCEEKEISDKSQTTNGFYKISQFETKPNTFQIIDSTIFLSDSLFVSFDEIHAYDSINHTFYLKSFTFEYNKISDVLDLHKAAFALVVDNDIIYYGFFWTNFSSMSCDWIVVDPIKLVVEKKLTINLGYPETNNQIVNDPRNHPKLLEFLKKDHVIIK